MTEEKELEKETPASAPEENKPQGDVSESVSEDEKTLQDDNPEVEPQEGEEDENKIPYDRFKKEIAKRKKLEEELAQYRAQIEEIKSKISGTSQERQEAKDALSELVDKYGLDEQTTLLLQELKSTIEKEVLEKQAPLYSLAADIGWKNEVTQLRNKYDDVDEYEGIMREMAKDERYNKLPAEDLYKLAKFERGETPKPKSKSTGVEGVKASPARMPAKEKDPSEMTPEELEEKLKQLGNFL